MIGHGFIGLLQSADYMRPPLRTTGVGPGSIVETAAGYGLSGFADTAFAWLDAPKSVGKWYWEVVKQGANGLFGIADDVATAVTYGGYSSVNAGIYTTTPNLWIDGGWTGASAGSWAGGTVANGDVLGFALDLDSGTKTLAISQNGVVQATQSWTGGPTTLWALFAFQFGPAAGVNLGPGGCVYEPPAGYAYL